MSIYFGEHFFSEPERLTSWKPPYIAGIYAILVDDPTVTPVPFRPIYFGETNNMAEPGLIQNHPLHDCWYNQTGSVYRLFITVYEMPDSTPFERQQVEAGLIRQYRPICNEPVSL
ncbi:MAG: hypothetical protein ACLFV2_05385 [Desulfurivibrionaceae bacterium]